MPLLCYRAFGSGNTVLFILPGLPLSLNCCIFVAECNDVGLAVQKSHKSNMSEACPCVIERNNLR